MIEKWNQVWNNAVAVAVVLTTITVVILQQQQKISHRILAELRSEVSKYGRFAP